MVHCLDRGRTVVVVNDGYPWAWYVRKYRSEIEVVSYAGERDACIPKNLKTRSHPSRSALRRTEN